MTWRSKRCRGVRGTRDYRTLRMDRTRRPKQFWKINLSFNNEDDKRDFQEKMDRAKESLCPGRPLDNFQLLSLMLQRFESEMSIVPELQATNMPGKHIEAHAPTKSRPTGMCSIMCHALFSLTLHC